LKYKRLFFYLEIYLVITITFPKLLEGTSLFEYIKQLLLFLLEILSSYFFKIFSSYFLLLFLKYLAATFTYFFFMKSPGKLFFSFFLMGSCVLLSKTAREKGDKTFNIKTQDILRNVNVYKT